MEMRHLRYFVAVAEEENITRAAQRLHVSQPPLSRQIRDLEDELRVELFTRTAKSIQLTKAGQVFLEEARAILRRTEEAVNAARSAAAGGESEIHIGYAPSPTSEFLSCVLNRFEKTMPGVRVSLYDMTSSEMLAGLRSKQLDAALIVEQPKPFPAGFRFEPLRSYPAGVIMPRRHRLAGRRKLRLEEVMDEPMAVLSRAMYSDYHRWLRKLMGKQWKKFRVAEECDGAMSLMTAVESGRAIAIIAESITSLGRDRLAFAPLSPAPRPLQVGVCFSKKLNARSATGVFIDAARAVVSAM